MKHVALERWVQRVVTRVGSQAEVSRLISKELRRDIDRAAVNKMAKGGRAVAADELFAMEAISGLPVPSPHLSGAIPLIDWVVAGTLTEPQSQIPIEEVPILAFGNLGKGEFFALAVKGDSMDRISPEGSIIVVDRTDKTLINGKAYVFALAGKTTFKLWQGGDPPYLAPFSTNPAHSPQFVKKKRDFEVIGRVKRTITDL